MEINNDDEKKVDKEIDKEKGFTYLGYFFPHEKDDIVRTLSGSETYFSRCVAYCCYHKVYLTSKQLHTKKCLTKNCGRYVRTPSNFWAERDRKKIEKKVNKIIESKYGYADAAKMKQDKSYMRKIYEDVKTEVLLEITKKQQEELNKTNNM